MKIALIDYGVGNLHSAAKALSLCAEKLGIPLDLSVGYDLETLTGADALVLPGDGAFAECRRAMAAIDGLEALIQKLIIHDKIPFLGICVGMQLLATYGHEVELTEGFNWIGGAVKPIERTHSGLKIPHMGWNDIHITGEHPLFNHLSEQQNQNKHKGLPAFDAPQAYFLHSYHFVCDNPAHVLATTDHGGPLSAIIGHDNIIGVQFHPEKSQQFGLQFLMAFLRWIDSRKPIS